MRALISSGRLWPQNILSSRVDLLVATAPSNCNSVLIFDQGDGDPGLYVIDGQYYYNISDLGLSENNLLVANPSILVLHRPSDL